MRRDPTMRDVAREAGVSVGTVSNAFNRPDLVSAATRARIERAVNELGFVRNLAAGDFRRGRSSSVGAVVLDLANPFFSEAAAAVEERLHEEGLVLALCSSQSDSAREAQALRTFQGSGVRGILLTPAGRDLALAESIAQAGTPVVLLDASTDSPHLSSVGVDDEAGAALAIEHLIAGGHRRVTFLNGPESIRQARSRSAGAQRAWADAGLNPGDLRELHCGSFTARAACTVMAQLIREDPPEAVFTGNDLMALGVLNAARAAGLRLPDDLALVGFDDISVASQFATPLTTVRQPMRQIGYTAAAMLCEEHDVTHVLLPPELIVRDSTR